MERRRYSRIALDIEGKLISEFQNKSYLVHIHDVSLKGAFVELCNFEEDPILFMGQSYILVIQLQATVKITMHMVCRHTVGKKLGLECYRIDQSSIAQLRRLVEMNLGNPETLNRELATMMHTDE